MATKKKEEDPAKKLVQDNGLQSFNTNIQKANNQTNTPQGTPSKSTTNNSQSKIIRDESTGQKTGITLPDGRTLTGLPAKEVSFLERKYYGTNEPMSNKFEVQNQPQAQPTIPPQTELLSGGATPQEIKQVGQLNQQINPQTILQSDEGIRTLYSDTLNKAMAREGNAGVIVTDTLFGLIPGGQAKKALINAITQDPNKKEYLSGYSNEDNMEATIRNLDLVETDIENAKVLAAIPGYSKQAIETYKTAQAKKQLYYTQLKILSSKDQRAYTTKALDEMARIESYWASGKINDDLEMQSRLNKANGVLQNG